MRECIGENEEIEDLINIVLNKTNISFKLNRLQTLPILVKCVCENDLWLERKIKIERGGERKRAVFKYYVNTSYHTYIYSVESEICTNS